MVDDLINTVGTALYAGTENLRRLPRNSEELATETQRLKDLRDDLRSVAENQARQTRGVISNQLSGWMTRVETLAADADQFKRCFEDGSSSRLVTRYSLAHNVVELLQEVARLIDQGNSLSDRGLLLQPQEPDSLQHVPSEITSATLVGAEGPLQQIKSYLMDSDIGIIGICGMGGVGKTTLLKVINNEFLTETTCRTKFDVAIWVTVSRDAKVMSSIRKTLANRLQISLTDDIAQNNTLFMELRKRRFILLLDDVWERLDLSEVGIPLPKNLENKSKILFTTRSEEVCCEMDADEIVKVAPLDAERSWELFSSKFGRNSRRVLDDPKIQPLARQVAAKCGGLPISLIIVGRAMATRAKTEDDWWEAIIKLDHRPEELSKGMENDVLQRLKFSFDKLRSKTLQDCLRYLALFPEDRRIEKDEIIDYWICEGLLDSDDFDEFDIEDTRRRARSLITELKNACLLEAREEDWNHVRRFREFVSLHDTVRDMALWITGHEFVVLAGSNCTVPQVPKLGIWEKATRISLVGNRQIEEPPSSHWDLNCPNLTTLLLRGSRLAENIPHDRSFLACTSMPALRVLDLTKVGLSVLPTGITSLISLQYLSLECNKLTFLPVELGNLVNLRKLNLRSNTHLSPIPREALLRLTSLQVLDMGKCQPHLSHAFLTRSELDDLKTLKSLSELHLRCDGACSWESLQVIVESPVLRRCIRKLRSLTSGDASTSRNPPNGHTISQQIRMLSERITWLELGGRLESYHFVNGELELHSDRLQHLEILHIKDFIEAKINIFNTGATPLFPRLRELIIGYCGCYDLSWIGGLPFLEYLKVDNCGKLSEILPEESDRTVVPSVFPKLKGMRLINLPSLKSICMHALLLPSLRTLQVFECPKLKQLPFRLPCLDYLRIERCGELTEVLPGETDDDDQTLSKFFPMLEHMELEDLPSLRVISVRTLHLHSLKKLIVKECPQLKRLPFGSESAPNLVCIKGSKTWWDGLEWNTTKNMVGWFGVEHYEQRSGRHHPGEIQLKVPPGYYWNIDVVLVYFKRSSLWQFMALSIKSADTK